MSRRRVIQPRVAVGRHWNRLVTRRAPAEDGAVRTPRYLLVLSLAALLSAGAYGQAPRPGSTPRPGASATPAATPPIDQGRLSLWKCELPGGTYEVLLRSIISVSSHEYLVDNLTRVTEVNVDTNGSTVVRFYYLEPVRPSTPSGIGQSALDRVQDLAKEAAGRAGADQIWQKVTKNYPTTTHAHTVEYRLESKDQLTKLFTSVEHAWRTGQGTQFKP
jgi:hypothetical protein